ncbi:MAG: hypothetical protein ACD_8C00022G0012 [uncultured bacterium]|nr:MAG: hypothetical protein ACD_8C00022G0012 [uncultured bacterium]
MNGDIFKMVEKRYKDDFDKLKDKRFHFASRLFLWTNDEFAKNKLAELKSEYIGTSEDEHLVKIATILKEDIDNKNILFRKEREKFLIKYPLLKKYNKILFKNLFCETIYGIDLKKVIDEKIKEDEFVKLRNDLLADKEAIAILSTHAINYFYTLDFYLKEGRTFFDPLSFIDIVANNEKSTASLRVYLLTHCIIGESAFYARYIRRDRKSYEKILLKIESIIESNYESISLDNKVEFLVCAKLCQKKSYLEKRIFSDVESAFDSDCRYFVEKGKTKNNRSFKKGEHRNVLALMAFYYEKKVGGNA